MPFNFDRLGEDCYFISNVAGFHDLLSENKIRCLIEEGSSGNKIDDIRLQGKLFLQGDKSGEIAKYALASGLAKKLINEMKFNPVYMIVPTLRCDHACTYCQVSRASLSSKNYDMPDMLIPKIIKNIISLSDPPYKIEVQGGEPLVRFDLIKKIYREAESMMGGDGFEMVIATSLSLLDKDVVAWAKNKKVFFSVSLDGDEAVHNKNRIISTCDSFQRLKRGIEKIRKELGEGRVSTVTTVTKDLIEYPESLVEIHKELDVYDLFVRPISPYGFAEKKYHEMYTIKEYMGFYKRLFEYAKSMFLKGYPFLEYSAAVHMKRVMKPGFSQYADLKSPGGFIFNSILFNYDGKMYGSDEARMLQRVIGGVDFSFGNVSGGGLRNDELQQDILSNSFNMIHPGCDQCAYQPFCGADPCQHIGQQGEPIGDKSLSLFCSYHKQMFRFLLSEYYIDSGSREMLREWCYG